MADRENLLAVVKNRFHVMALYGRNVVVPVLRFETRIADAPTRRLLKRARPLIIREYLQPDEVARHTLNSALETSQTLATVYRFKEQLRELWTNASFGPEKRLEALREWCRQAEETGIQCLQSFAALLRGYSVSQSIR
jgi:stearoyl-CoA desaturase (delta-9 desaturase)